VAVGRLPDTAAVAIVMIAANRRCGERHDSLNSLTGLKTLTHRHRDNLTGHSIPRSATASRCGRLS
jgi:hypothetical protein